MSAIERVNVVYASGVEIVYPFPSIEAAQGFLSYIKGRSDVRDARFIGSKT